MSIALIGTGLLFAVMILAQSEVPRSLSLVGVTMIIVGCDRLFHARFDFASTVPCLWCSGGAFLFLRTLHNTLHPRTSLCYNYRDDSI